MMIYLINFKDNYGTYYYDDGSISADDFKDYRYIADHKHSTARPAKNKKYCYLYITIDDTQVASVFTRDEFKKAQGEYRGSIKEVQYIDAIISMDNLIELPKLDDKCDIVCM